MFAGQGRGQEFLPLGIGAMDEQGLAALVHRNRIDIVWRHDTGPGEFLFNDILCFWIRA